jgi:hypothetical protein
MWRAATLLLASWSALTAQQSVAGPEGGCGFSKFRPLQLAHYVDRGAVGKATPQYPLAAAAKGLTGNVRVRALVNKQGLVSKAGEQARGSRLMNS